MSESDLRERVARAMCDAVNVEGTWEETGTLHREKVWLTAADAAIAIVRAEVLEEAARVVRRMPSPSSEWMAEELLRALGGHANPIPDNIRALKEKPYD